MEDGVIYDHETPFTFAETSDIFPTSFHLNSPVPFCKYM